MFTHPLSRRCVSLCAVLACSSAASLALLVTRFLHTGVGEYRFLVWNLLLAWIPFGLALCIRITHARGRRYAFLLVAAAILWLLFLPNAPYLLTDLLHLRPRTHPWGRPHWYDVLMLASFAWNGLLLGFASLLLVHLTMAERWGRTRAWAGVVMIVALASTGVYIGRFLRWNSWDVFTDAHWLFAMTARSAMNPWDHVRPIAFVIGYSTFLLLAYASVVGIASLGREPVTSDVMPDER